MVVGQDKDSEAEAIDVGIDSKDIEKECFNALAGASEVKSRILSGLAMGNPSIESKAHLIKCRVKSHVSLMTKVLDRRKKNPSYKASDVTDIVGLRLLSLFRMDLPELTDLFLSFVENGQKKEMSLFVGDTFKDAISEIIVYKSDVSSNQTVNRILEYFRERNLAIETLEENQSANDSRADVKVIQKKNQYSSIHIIVRCRNCIRDDPNDAIAMEVQIRTPLEDVWGEIDHGLFYKNTMVEHQNDSEEAENWRRDVRERLDYLKQKLDICNHEADSIFRNVKFRARSLQAANVETSTFSINLETLQSLSVPNDMTEKLKGTVAELRKNFEAFNRADGSLSRSKAVKFSKLFDQYAAIFERIRKRSEECPNKDERKQGKIIYYLLMEEALCLFLAGKALDTPTAKYGPTAEDKSKAEEFFSKSFDRYSEVESFEEDVKDAVLAFRISNVLSALKAEDAAFERIKAANHNLQTSKQPTLDDTHFLRIRIPRLYGLMLWNKADELRQKGEQLGLKNFELANRRAYYLQAIKATLPVLNFDYSYEGSLIEGMSADGTDENDITKNNLLDYALAYLKAGGAQDELDKEGLTSGMLHDFLKDISKGKALEEVRAPFILDTIRKARLAFFNDIDGAKQAARRALEVLDEDEALWASEYGTDFVDEIRADAGKTLSGK